MNGSNVPPAKRRKLDNVVVGEAASTSVTSTSLSRPVSPPRTRRKTPVPVPAALLEHVPSWSFDDVPKQTATPPPSQPRPLRETIAQSTRHNSNRLGQKKDDEVTRRNAKSVASPFQLARIRDLALDQNVDTIELKDILGDPIIRECWNFNFLFDIDFVMQQFDEDVRDLVQIKIVHGFWKRDDERRINLMETAERYSNIELINAYLPDPFGTHHSKMLVLLRHDDTAQIVIHTANMISKDWTNMTQAVWRSPLLPFSGKIPVSPSPHAIGTGSRFQVDLLRYLGNYERRLRRLSDQLAMYNFSTVKAAFIGSTPSRQVVASAIPVQQTSFGWLGLKEILSSVPIRPRKCPKKPPHIVLQVSSIATLGAAPTWLSHFQSVLARSHTRQQSLLSAKPKYNIIFPTAEEVRTSLDGYASGGSIHMKVQSAQQQKQLEYLHPLFCHWKHPSTQAPTSQTSTPAAATKKEALRGPAAPHIKTYIRFSDDTHKGIDWALLTSANLSKQAWGDVVNKQGEVRIQSYETGVLVWPELFAEPGSEISMVPVFGRDTPTTEDVPRRMDSQVIDTNTADTEVEQDDVETEDENDDVETEDEDEEAQHNGTTTQTSSNGKAPLEEDKQKRVIVGLRMPYDLPLSSYTADDKPWCATQSYAEPDWKGRAWGGW